MKAISNRVSYRLALAAWAGALCLGLAHAELVLTPIAGGLAQPVDITHAGDGSGRLFIVEQPGRIRVVTGTTLDVPPPFLDITARVLSGGERGLLGLAFHPRYRENGLFFVNYTRRDDGATVIARFQRSAANANSADASSFKELLVIPQPYANHNGGQIKFGPDGYLYIGMGDGGAGNDPQNNSQTLTSALGKMLRIDVDRGDPYAIPPDNPFVDLQIDLPPPAGTLRAWPLVWQLGLRNPWRFSFDRLSGDLFIGDVGQGAREEVSWVRAGQGRGANFGWRVFEGTRCNTDIPGVNCSAPLPGASNVPPILEYGHDEGCSVTGGYLYRGAAAPELNGAYVFADFCSGTVWAAWPKNATQWSRKIALQSGFNVSTFGEDESGELYIADHGGGRVLRVSSNADVPQGIEYYNTILKHYFIASDRNDVNTLDSGAAGPGWVRTGLNFKAFRASDGGALPVFRFYASGPNSHFYTASTEERDFLLRFDPGWQLEGTAFYIKMPTGGVCPDGTSPIYRAYNNRFAQNDSNHRYATSVTIFDQMGAQGWAKEGVAMCSAN